MRRPGGFRVRATAIAAAGMLLLGCGGQDGSSRAEPTSSDSGAGRSGPPAASAAAMPASPPPTASPSHLPELPRGGRILFPQWRIVAFYGAAGYPAMGVLGSGGPDEVWPRLARQADRYSRPGKPVLPAYELIVVIASSKPEKDGKYRRRVDPAIIDRYLEAARRHDALLILDVQPGQGDFLTEAKRLSRWLDEPDVALALDPEWRMRPGERPGEKIGSVSAKEINKVSGWLNDLTRQRRLPEKLLLVHQFTDDMVRNQDAVRGRSDLEIVFNMDGFGSPGAKTSRYRALADKTDFRLGFKLFYDEDTDLLAPRRVLDLAPVPRVVEYQ